MQSLVNGNFGDHHLHLKSYASLYLRSIFSALRKAEDAADAQITPVIVLLSINWYIKLNASKIVTIIDTGDHCTVHIIPHCAHIVSMPVFTVEVASVSRSGTLYFKFTEYQNHASWTYSFTSSSSIITV